MDPAQLDANDPAFIAADEHLRQLEAEQAKEMEAVVTSPPEEGDTTQSGDRAPDGGKKEESAPENQTDDQKTEAAEIEAAQAAAEKEGKELVKDDSGKLKRDEKGQFVKQDKKSAEQAIILTKDELDKFSKWQKQKNGQYAQDNLKRLIRWDNIKAEEARVKQVEAEAKARHEAAVKQFNAEVANWKAEQAANTPTPEKYEAFAAKCDTNAKLKEAEAITAENNGDVEKAAALRDEAKVLKVDANRAKQQAEHVRKNPPADAAKLQEQFKTHQQQWIGKATTDFPEFKVKDSPVQKAALEYYNQMAKQEPAAAKLPGFIYFCAERAAMKIAADRVPSLEKELGELRAKVKEQDALLNPVPRGGGGVQRNAPVKKSFEQMTPDEQYAELQREAAEMPVR